MEPVNDRFADAVNYLSYRLFKKSFRYNNGVAHEFQKMTKKITIQMKDHTFSR